MRITKSANGWTISTAKGPQIEVLTFIEAWCACWEIRHNAALEGIAVQVTLG